jgi:hypothetical protein
VEGKEGSPIAEGSALPIDGGLWHRFREAGALIAWRNAPRARGKRSDAGPLARIAKLHDEEARVELRDGSSPSTVVVESGPVGALVLLLEIDRRGSAPVLTTLEGGTDPAFPNGAVVARWDAPGSASSSLSVKDLIEVARFALP